MREGAMLVVDPDVTIRKKTKKKPTINIDLPSEVTITAGIVDITHDNAVLIRDKILSHPAYAYTRFVRKAFLSTKPGPKRPLTVEDIIHRLVIINQIDGINLDTNPGTGGFDALAASIFSERIEDKIAKGEPIDDATFKSIAIRRSVKPDGKSTGLFSAVTKYIARTAQFVYGIVDGYPIFDSVLGEHLSLYIQNVDFEAIRKSCDYGNYCSIINKYLSKTINVGVKKSDPNYITNLDFDRIVWFSYKTPNAAKKYL